MGLLSDIKAIIVLALTIGDLITVTAMVVIFFQNKEAIMNGDIDALSFVVITVLLIAINGATFGLMGLSSRPPRV